MKRILVALMASLPMSAYAVVADSFECKIQIVDSATSESVTQNVTLFAARLPLNQSPYPDARLTNATVNSETEFKVWCLLQWRA